MSSVVICISVCLNGIVQSEPYYIPLHSVLLNPIFTIPVILLQHRASVSESESTKNACLQSFGNLELKLMSDIISLLKNIWSIFSLILRSSAESCGVLYRPTYMLTQIEHSVAELQKSQPCRIMLYFILTHSLHSVVYVCDVFWIKTHRNSISIDFSVVYLSMKLFKSCNGNIVINWFSYKIGFKFI